MSSLQRNSLWLLFARISAQALAILSIAIAARRLGLESFGQFTFISAVILIGNTFTNFGTDTYIIREVAHTRQIVPLVSRALGLQLLLSALWMSVTLLLRSGTPLILYSLALFPLAISSVATATLRAFERMELVWILSLANGIVQLIGVLISSNIQTLCLFLLIGQLLLAALAYGICIGSLPGFSLFPIKDMFPLFKLTLPFAVLTLLIVASQRLGVLTVSSLIGDTATGIFSSVTRVVDGLKLGHYAILGALLPVLARGSQESKQSFRKGFFLLMGFSLMMAIGLFIYPRIIILLLYGEKYSSAIHLLSLLGWSLIPYTISSFISYDLIAHGQEKTLVTATAVSLVTFLVLYLWLISAYNLNGAIYAALAGEIVQAIIFIVANQWSRRRGSLPGRIETSVEFQK